MLRRAIRSVRGWRQVTAGVLVYALVLQGLAVALVGAQLAASAAADGVLAGYELCHHDAGASDVPVNGPEAPAESAHCIFCLVAANQAADVPAGAPEYVAVAVPMAPWPFVVWRLPAATVDPSARPRGPPATV